MKKLFALLVCVLLVFALASCGDDPCSHRDADDNSLCDKCGESYTDGKDVEGSTPCSHRDADDNSLCDKCGESYTDGKDLPDEHTHDYTVKSTDSKYLDKAADCENAATYFYSCSCGAKGTETFTSGNACGHIYSDEWTIDIQATCITKGSKSHHCTRCNGKSELTEIPTTSLHNVVDGYCDYCDRQESTDGLEYAQNPDGTYTVTGIGSCALQDIVIEIYNNRDVTSIGDYAFVDCTSLTSVTIPDSVTSIGEGAFFRSGLTSVAIGKGVTSIGEGAFCWCDITSIAVDENNNCFRSIDGNLYTKDKQTLIKYAVGKTDTEFIISDSVTSIGSSAFEYCKSLTSITIPDSITSIGSGAFSYCSSLTSITIPDSVTSIGSSAFAMSYSLTSIKYCGTSSQWNAISKGNYWDYNTGSYTITYNYTGE